MTPRKKSLPPTPFKPLTFHFTASPKDSFVGVPDRVSFPSHVQTSSSPLTHHQSTYGSNIKIKIKVEETGEFSKVYLHSRPFFYFIPWTYLGICVSLSRQQTSTFRAIQTRRHDPPQGP